MDEAEFRQAGEAIVAQVARYYRDMEARPVRAQIQPGAIAAALPDTAPETGEDMSAILDDVERLLVPGLTHWQHPMFMAYFPSISSPASVLGEMLASGFGVNAMMWETSPAATELEERVLAWLAKAFDLPDGFQGVIQDTASTATLCAAIAAREFACGYQGLEQGGKAFANLTAYGSAEAHSSVEKAAVLAGFGRSNFRPVPVDHKQSMRPEALEAAINADLARGMKPAFCVATLGTTALGGFDDVDAIGQICERYGLWFHVDAAWAGSALILPEQRAMAKGMARAHSLVINPHKWLMTTVDCSVLFVRAVEAYTRAFANNPEYLRTANAHAVTDYRNWGIALGRRFRALKLWFVLRRYGLEELRRLIRHHISLAQTLADRLAATPSFEILIPPRLALFVFHYNPAGVDGATVNDLNVRLLDAINNGGELYLTRATVDGKAAIRVSVGQMKVDHPHMDKAWRVITAAAKGLHS